MIHKKRKRVQKAGKKFELKHLIRLVFWRKKPHIVTDIGGGAPLPGRWRIAPRFVLYWGDGRVFRVSERPERGL